MVTMIDVIAKDFLGHMLRPNLTGREAFTDVYAGHFISLAYIGAKEFCDQAEEQQLRVGHYDYEIAKALVQARLASSKLAITPELVKILTTSSIHMSKAMVSGVRAEMGLPSEVPVEPEVLSVVSDVLLDLTVEPVEAVAKVEAEDDEDLQTKAVQPSKLKKAKTAKPEEVESVKLAEDEPQPEVVEEPQPEVAIVVEPIKEEEKAAVAEVVVESKPVVMSKNQMKKAKALLKAKQQSHSLEASPE